MLDLKSEYSIVKPLTGAPKLFLDAVTSAMCRPGGRYQKGQFNIQKGSFSMIY